MKTNTPEDTPNGHSSDAAQEHENHADNLAASGATEELSFEKKYNDINDKYLRLHAEFDNYRKRSIKERIDIIQNASEHLISELLTVTDDFERALQSFEKTTDLEVLKEGVYLIQSKFKKLLESKGLKEINTVNESFDVNFHEAVAYMPTESDETKNKVIEEVQKGYLLNEKIIRFAKVVVGK